jgi:acyl-CoA synthetase (AMP-forming)/AMP-acid ligase II
MNIGSVLTQAAKASPEHTAIIYGDLRRTYREFNARANQLAGQLRKAGVKKGDRIAILQKNCPELLETMFATFKTGAITVPMNARLHPKEVAYILQDSGAKAVVFTDDFTAALETIRGEIGDVTTFVCVGRTPTWAESYEQFIDGGDARNNDENCDKDDLAWLFYTSGTTGKPKGAMDSHCNLQFMTDHYPGEVYQLKPDDIVMHPGPLTHGSGLWALPITAGAGTHLIPTGASFDPDQIFKLIETHRVHRAHNDHDAAKRAEYRQLRSLIAAFPGLWRQSDVCRGPQARRQTVGTGSLSDLRTG